MEDDERPGLTAPAPGERERRRLRGFGAGLGAVLLFIAWRRHSSGPACAAAACWSLAALLPAAFAPLYAVWMPAARALARVNLWLVCLVLYYLLVTPYALLLRALGRRPLALGLREKESYWVEKAPRDPAVSARRLF